MKWLQSKIFSVLVSARAVETNGAETAGAKPAAPAASPTVFKKSRLVVARPGLFPLEAMSHLPLNVPLWLSTGKRRESATRRTWCLKTVVSDLGPLSQGSL